MKLDKEKESNGCKYREVINCTACMGGKLLAIDKNVSYFKINTAKI